MKAAIEELTAIIDAFGEKFRSIPETQFSEKPLPHKWSKKEVLGHLIDSAQNNLRRFICGQYESSPPVIAYNQDFWVSANAYQDMSKADVILLWKAINERIVAVLRNMPEKNFACHCDTGRGGVAELHDLRWLAGDYVKHMKHHLNQIIPGSFDVIYVST